MSGACAASAARGALVLGVVCRTQMRYVRLTWCVCLCVSIVAHRWFAAMESRPTYLGTRSDYYTHAHDLPPQVCVTAAAPDCPRPGPLPWSPMHARPRLLISIF